MVTRRGGVGASRGKPCRRIRARGPRRINAKRDSVADPVVALPKRAFRRLVWRDGTGHNVRSRFCFVRFKTTHDDGIELVEREPLWLVAEWPEGKGKPMKFVLTTLPSCMSRKQIVGLLKER